MCIGCRGRSGTGHPAPADQPLGAHDPRYPLPTDAHALVAERPMHSRPTVGAARLVVDLGDAFTKLLIGELTKRRQVLMPFVEGGPGDLEQLARPFHRVALLSLL